MPQVSRTIAPSKLPAHLSNHEPTSSCRNTSQSTVTKLLMESLRLLACFRPNTAYSFRSNPFQHPNTPSGVRTSEWKAYVYHRRRVLCPLAFSSSSTANAWCLQRVSPHSRARSTSILLRNPTAHLPSSLSSTSSFPRRHDGESLCRHQKSAYERIPRQRDLHKCHYCRCCYELRNLRFSQY